MNTKKYVTGVVETLEGIVDEELWYCGKCGSFYHERALEFDKSNRTFCPYCMEEHNKKNRLRKMKFSDYIDDYLGCEYRVDGKSHDTINSVSICIAYGGPSVYIDTGDRKVKLYWTGMDAEAQFSSEVAEALNAHYDKKWNESGTRVERP